jgi:hypothetical protein
MRHLLETTTPTIPAEGLPEAAPALAATGQVESGAPPAAAIASPIGDVLSGILRVCLTLPLAAVSPKGTPAYHIDGQLWTIERRQTMARLRVGLAQAGASTSDGKPINSEIQVVRWLLDEIARALVL